MQNRVIMLVDFDYFFAQCEELRNPALKNKPVVVGVYSGRTENSGAVSTANYIARKFGVKSGIPLYLAKKRLEGVESVFLRVDTEFYEKISNKIMQILRKHADSFEQMGIDEAYLDVTKKTQGSFEAAIDSAQKIKTEIEKAVGITFSVGIGPNKLVAKIAADSQKPDGLTIIKPEEIERFLSPLPVNRLIGVGRKITAKLGKLGIITIGDLAMYNVEELTRNFGKKLGIYFHNAANGMDGDPVKESGEAESISRISTLKEDTRDLLLVLESSDKLIEDIQKELEKKNAIFKQVGIVAVMSDLTVRSRSRTLETYTNKEEDLRKNVHDLFQKFIDEMELEIRRVGVKIANFAKKESKQKELTSFFQNA